MEVTAAKKQACPSCGAETIWDPAKGCPVCPYCGTSVPIVETESGEIIEHDLVAALRSLSDDARGWKAEKSSVRCEQCKAVSVFDPGLQGHKCAFCGSSQLVPFEETKQPFRPESVLPIRISEQNVRDEIKSWYAKRWFAPNNLKRLSATDRVKGIYLPFWTFDAHANAQWSAEAGYYYYTEESYRDSNGETKTRRVQHTRWEDASGSVEHFFDDTLVCASVGVPQDLIEAVGPFPTDELTPYEARYIAGWTVEHYQVDLVAAASQSRNAMEDELRSMCAAAVPGDTHRGLTVQSSFSNQTFKHILAPIWLVTYTYGTDTYRVLVNGVTGKIVGHYPKSWIKIALAVFTVVVILGVWICVVNHK